MENIIGLMWKRSTGKDHIYKKLTKKGTVGLRTIVPYTTRPIRIGEENGVEYFFTDEEGYQKLKEDKLIIEAREYETYYGVWRYFTVNDSQIDLEHPNYCIIGTLESYLQLKNYFGVDKVVPILIELNDGIRLQRALNREKKQEQPKYEEMCRRFLADSEDFKEERLLEAGIKKRFVNEELHKCLGQILYYIKTFI